MPPKDLPLPNPQDAESPNQPTFQLPIRSYDSDGRRLATEKMNADLLANGLTVDNAIRIIHLGPLDDSISTPVRKTAAVGLGLCEVDDPAFQEFDTSDLRNVMSAADHNRKYGNFLRQIDDDVRAAVSFAEFQIDPREMVREYRDFPWEEYIASRLRVGEAQFAKPSFATFVRMILHSSMLLKSKELYNKGREIESTIPPEKFTFGPGFRGGHRGQFTPEDQAKLAESGRYKWAEQTVESAALKNADKRRESGGVSDFTWSDLVRSLTNLKSTQALVANSQFVDDILARTEPVQVSNPYGTRPQSPKVDLATLIKPKVTVSK